MVLFAYVGHIETSVLNCHTFKETQKRWKQSCCCFSLEHPATYHAAVILPHSGDAALTCGCDLNQAVAFRKTPRSHEMPRNHKSRRIGSRGAPTPSSTSCSSRRTPADPEQLTSAISRRRRTRGCCRRAVSMATSKLGRMEEH